YLSLNISKPQHSPVDTSCITSAGSTPSHNKLYTTPNAGHAEIPPELLQLSPCSHVSPLKIQDIGYGLQNHQQMCSLISTRPDRSLHPNQTATLLHLCLFGGPTHKRSKIKSTKIFGSGSDVLE
ncbi:hypothetical protein Z043_124438, partial [Scleropages formosus]